MRSCSISQIKNESGILSCWMDVVGNLVDYIIIIDDNSEDDSKDIVLSHEYSNKVVWLENDSNKREEGRLFKICQEKALELDCKRMYISDPDEIPKMGSIPYFLNIINDSNFSAKIHRAELAIDQKSVYGRLSGGGKLVITNCDAEFNNNVIHSSQPNIKGEIFEINPDICLLHYGTSDYGYQVFKCLSYIVWENKSINKPYVQGYNEYFKMYNNFLKHGEEDAYSYFTDTSILPYKHWMPKEVRDFCESINVFEDFDISYVVECFLKIPYCKKEVLERM